MKKTVLVLTNSEDGQHSEVVISKLAARDEQVFRFDSDALSSGKAKILFASARGGAEFIIEQDGRSVSSADVKSVWYRRPNRFKLEIRDPVQKSFAEAELRSFLEGLWAILENRNVFWLSKPAALERGRKKLLQLELAARKGMRTPPTIVTNDPEEVRRFYTACAGKMVFKAIYHEFLDYGDRAYNIPTTLIGPEHLPKLDLVRRSPTLFQQYIEKDHELRVTAVGERAFAAKIDSQKNPLAVVDWRTPKCVQNLDYSKAELDPGVEAFCREMLRDLDLAFGAFDFIVDKKGELWFLEVNPNGQWYWLEDRAGLLISDAIVDILRAERR